MTNSNLLPSSWDAEAIADMSPVEQLVYRSNILGADKRVTNYGGGNTSAKLRETDPLSGEAASVLWVKGSGGDLGSITRDGFASLYQDKLMALQGIYGGPDEEDAMVGMLPHCTFGLNPRAPSIDTCLHAFVPYAHVDHMHPDAVIGIAAASNSKELTQTIFGARIGWLPWKRPGFELALMLQAFVRDNPEAEGVVLESHGLFTWGDTGEACYMNTLKTINEAIDWFDAKSAGTKSFGGQVVAPRAAEARQEMAAKLMALLRREISKDTPKVGDFNDAPSVLEFVGSKDLDAIAELGTSCPDHFLRTKIKPLVLRIEAEAPDEAAIAAAIEAYRGDYAAYYEACKHPDSPAMRDPNPVVFLVPGVGMISFAKDKPTARISGEFYRNAINVARYATSVSTYVGLPRQEAFDIEYWLLEEAKLQRMPKPKRFNGRIALVTGAAGGIGAAICDQILADGGCVALTDIAADRLAQVEARFAADYGADFVTSFAMDVTDERAVAAAMRHATLTFGGLDFLVANAGIAGGAPVTETSVADWDKNMDILGKGYFLSAREAFRLFEAQGIGGSIVFIASKNGLAASAGAAAYCSAKAAEIHLARCLALEGAAKGIRVNTVNPDAVIQGSQIWSGEWKEARAKAYNISQDELQDHYKNRSLLKRAVLPEDIATATTFLLSDAAAKSTGNILNVDAGNQMSFPR